MSSTLPGAADLALVRGDLDVAYVQAMRAAEFRQQQGIYLVYAGRAALWARDIERARVVADRLDAMPDAASALVMAQRAAMRAGVAALESRRDEAIAGYRDALRRYEAIESYFPRALVALDFLVLIGPDELAAREAGLEARVVFERVGARPFLERLDAGLVPGSAPSGPEAASVAQPAASRSVEASPSDAERAGSAAPQG